MNEQSHVSRQFDEDLGSLRTHVLEMGGLVESQIQAAIEAHGTVDTMKVKTVIDNDQKVNAYEKIIDDACIQVIARRQPAASDLRLVMGISKIVTDLERIGDEAKKIAKGAGRLHERGSLTLPQTVDVRHVAQAATAMLRAALDCFARFDAGQAGSVINADARIDAEFKAILRQLITYMMEDPRTISDSVDILWIARAIERIGDHAKNIAENVVYIVEGRDIRHSSREQGA